MNKHSNRIGTSLLVAIMKGKHKWTTKLPPLIHDGGGLYLQPREGGGGIWRFRYSKDGKPTFTGLGRLEDVSATEARHQRDVLKVKLRSGGDPVRDRQREVAVARASGDDLSTFRLAAEQWKALRAWTPQRQQTMVGILDNHVLPVLGDLAVDDITGGHIIRLMSAIKSRDIRSRSRQIIVEVIDCAMNQRPEKDQRPNPADSSLLRRTLTRSKLSGGTSQPHAKMAVADVPAFMARLWAKKSVSGLGLMAIILTGLRVKEALHGRWSEIKGDVWTIPGDDPKTGVVGRMKGKEGKARQQRVPISPGLKMVLDTLRPLRRETDDYIFPSHKGQPVQVGTMWNVLKDYGRKDITTHGFRSTLMDFCSAQDPPVPFEVCEAMLHHVLPGVGGRHYHYDSDWLGARVAPMKAWSDHCLSAIPAEQRHLRVVA